MTNLKTASSRRQSRAWLFIALAFFTLNAHAEAPSQAEWIKMGSISATSAGFALGLRFVPTTTCSWCKTNSFDETIAQSWQASNVKAARITSDVVTFGVVPAVALTGLAMFTPDAGSFVHDGMVIITSALTASALTEGVKIAARRQRPDAYYGHDREKSDQDNRSFLSGHTSFAFSILTSASVLAIKRGSRYAPMFAAGAFVVATTAGVTRILAAKHWATDVLAGVALGVAVGAVMPFLVMDQKSTDNTTSFYTMPDTTSRGLLIGMRW